MTDGAATERSPLTAAAGPAAVRIDERDNVAVALRLIPAGDRVEVDGSTVIARQEIPAGHKIALESLQHDEQVVKYGVPIGLTTERVAAGDWVHSQNLRTALSGLVDYQYHPAESHSLPASRFPLPVFKGFLGKFKVCPDGSNDGNNVYIWRHQHFVLVRGKSNRWIHLL